MKKLYIGDCEVKSKKKQIVYVDRLSVNKVSINSFVPVRFVIDLDGMRVDKKKLRAVLNVKGIDVICRTCNESKVEGVVRLFDKVIYHYHGGRVDLFKVLRMIFTEPDREKVFRLLVKAKLPARVLLKWVISNIAMDDRDNMNWVQLVDVYSERVNPMIVLRMLSLFDPGYSKGKRFYYNFGKREA